MDDTDEMTVQTEEEEPFVASEKIEEMYPERPWTDILTDYWFLWVVIAVSSVYVYHTYVAPAIEKWLQDRSDRELEAKLHKNPDLLRARREALESARRQMQEQHDKEATRMAEVRKAREEKKKEEMLAKQTAFYGNRLNENTDRRGDSSAPRPRSEYNPLMGSGSGGYRPPRRSCPGGGCG